MMGPRFSMHPMMYGQYPYPAVHPYMAYYQQGFLQTENSQLPYDNYYTSLNPFAEPWKPGMGPGHSHDRRAQFPGNQGMEKCSVCCERDEEEQRKRHLCDKHKHEKDVVDNHESLSKKGLTDKLKLKYAEAGKSNQDEGPYNLNGYDHGSSDYKKLERDSVKSRKLATASQGYSYENEASNSEDETPEWSTNDDFEEDDYNYSEDVGGQGNQLHTDVKQYDKHDYQQDKLEKVYSFICI